MDFGLSDRRVLVTGGGKGVGKSIALTIAKEGATVCVLSRTESELKIVCDEIKENGGKAIYRVFDLASDNNSYDELKKSIYDEIGGIDVLINNAAKTSFPKKISFMAEDDWYKTIDIDLNSQFKLIRLFIEDMKNNQWGRIIMIGSLSGVFGAASYPVYCTVKAGLEGLVKNLAVDYSKHGITTNMVSPGFVETERFKKAAPKELLEKFVNASSVKRLGQPEDIAKAVTFLASDSASFITGVNIPVCGGLNLGNLW